MERNTFVTALSIAQSMLDNESYARYERAMQVAYLNSSLKNAADEYLMLERMRKVPVDQAIARKTRMEYLNSKMQMLSTKLATITTPTLAECDAE